MKLYLIFPILFSSLAVANTPAGKCDFESITQSCKMFDLPDSKIQFPDGTFIPKLNVLAFEAQVNSSTRDNGPLEENTHKMVSAQLEMMKILDEVPSRRLSSRAKMILASNPALFGGVWSETFDDFSGTLAAVSLPWPLRDRDAQITRVEMPALKKELQKIFNPNQQKRMLNISQDIMATGVGAYATAQTPKHSLTSEMAKISASRRKRAEELVEFVRESMVRNIVGTRSKEQWSPEELAAVEKIKAITYNVGDDLNVRNSANCQGVVPNAFYNPASNSINLCTNFYNYPDASIVAVLGHEMGHAVDPCGCQSHFHTINGDKLAEFWKNGAYPPEIENSDDLKSAADSISQLAGLGIKVTAFPIERFLDDPKRLDLLIKAGILTPGPGKVKTLKQDGNSLDGYFMNDVYKCLLTTTDGSFRQTTPADIEDAADQVVNQRQAVAGAAFDGKKEKESIVRAFQHYPQCLSPRSKSQTGEVMSDWFGAKALGEFLEGRKLETAADRLAPVAFFANMVCMERADVEQPAKTIEGIAKSVKLDLRKDAGEHPASVTRLEKVMLADVRVRKALGCSEKIASTCEHNTGAIQSTRVQTPETHQ